MSRAADPPDLLAELQRSIDRALGTPADTHRPDAQPAATAPAAPSGGDPASEPIPQALRTSRPAAPKGPWQLPRPTLAVCARHRNLCAYRQGDPDRCDGCHASWDAITGTWQDATARAAHLAEHARVDAAAAKSRERKAGQ